jgi:SAM-dependent methyltransferase
MSGSELHVADAYPCLTDRTKKTPFDAHYFFQPIWAMERIVRSGAVEHVDIGSQISFPGMLSAIMPVTFLDLRPLEVEIGRLRSIAGDLNGLPFADQSLSSVSCLHVVEHVGLGRYGDPLDPHGSRVACKELQRVLAKGGSLYLSVPVGRERVCFNAHRVHDPRTILGWFDGLELVEFSAVDDSGKLQQAVEPAAAASFRYGCGLFHLRRSDESRSPTPAAAR